MRNQYIIVATDHFTRWAEVKALKRKTSVEVAKFLIEDIMCNHGAPSHILSDQGREFANECVKKVSELLGSEKSFTSAYNPRCNGSCERLNRTLISELARLCDGKWSQWDEFLPMAAFCYRIAPIGKIKRSPFEMLYGRQPRLTWSETGPDYDNHLALDVHEEDLLLKVEAFRKAAQDSAVKARNDEIEIANKTSAPGGAIEFAVGDIVLKMREPFEKENKLSDKWIGPFSVTKVFDKGSYEIENPFGRRFVYNRRKLKFMEGSDAQEWDSDEFGSMLPDDHKICMIIGTTN